VLNRKDKVEELEAVSAQLSQTNVLALPFMTRGRKRLKRWMLPTKVISISTGLADLDLTNDVEIDVGALYAASKAAMNVIMAKYNAQYKKDGVLFMSISPGVVEVGHYANSTYSCLQD
jgi:NAD(P)-dependent dehydrogenase (short-subunit alcohol dehydrogenase family)